MSSKKPVIHGRDHVAEGSDPIPGIETLPPGQGFAGNWPDIAADLGPVGYWRLGDGDVPYADTSTVSPAKNATFVGPGPTPMSRDVVPGLLPAGQDDGAVAFHTEGNDSVGSPGGDHLEAGNDTKFDFSSRHAMSAITRIQPAAATNTFWGGVVSDFSSDFHTSGGWALLVHFPALAVSFMRCTDPTARVFCSTAAGALVAGQAYSVAATYDGTVSRVYVNGVLAASVTDTASFTYGLLNDIFIGSARGSTPTFGTQWPFVGVIDEVAVYNRALTDAEVAALHAAAVSVAEGSVLTSDGAGGMVWAPVPPSPILVTVNGS